VLERLIENRQVERAVGDTTQILEVVLRVRETSVLGSSNEMPEDLVGAAEFGHDFSRPVA